MRIFEDYNKNKTRKRNEMEADSEGRRKREEKISRLSNSSSTSHQVEIYSDYAEETSRPTRVCDSCSARMDQRHSKLGANPNGVPTLIGRI